MQLRSFWVYRKYRNSFPSPPFPPPPPLHQASSSPQVIGIKDWNKKMPYSLRIWIIIQIIYSRGRLATTISVILSSGSCQHDSLSYGECKHSQKIHLSFSFDKDPYSGTCQSALSRGRCITPFTTFSQLGRREVIFPRLTISICLKQLIFFCTLLFEVNIWICSCTTVARFRLLFELWTGESLLQILVSCRRLPFSSSSVWL